VKRVPRTARGFGALWLESAGSRAVLMVRAVTLPQPLDVLSVRARVIDADLSIAEARTYRVLLPGAPPGGWLLRLLCNEHVTHLVVAALLVAQGIAEDAYMEVRVPMGDVDVVAEARDGSLYAFEVKPWFVYRGEDTLDTALQELRDKIFYYTAAGYNPFNLVYASICGGRPWVAEEAAARLGIGFVVLGPRLALRPGRLLRVARPDRLRPEASGRALSAVMGHFIHDLRLARRAVK